MRFLFIGCICLILSGCAHTKKPTTLLPPPSLNETVVLLHGFFRGALSLKKWSKSLEDVGYQTCRVHYKSVRQDFNHVQNLVNAQIDSCLSHIRKKVHFVGHSLGGLFIRSYLDKNKIKNLGHVVLVASPNKGTELVDHFKDRWWFKYMGDIPLYLSSKKSTFLESLKRPYYKLGVIAGNLDLDIHEDILPGPDDGIVRISSTKLEGMSDFIIIDNIYHGYMRYDQETINQILHFISYGKFNHS